VDFSRPDAGWGGGFSTVARTWRTGCAMALMSWAAAPGRDAADALGTANRPIEEVLDLTERARGSGRAWVRAGHGPVDISFPEAITEIADMRTTAIQTIPPTGLIKFDEALHAIEQARSVDEVKQIRDKAEAARVYAKQALASIRAQNMLAEIKIRAERKAGQLLKEMQKAKGGGDPKKHRLHDDTGAPSLESIGVSKLQSHRWQKEAELPEADFKGLVAEKNARREPLTSASVRRAVAEQQPRPQCVAPKAPVESEYEVRFQVYMKRVAATGPKEALIAAMGTLKAGLADGSMLVEDMGAQVYDAEGCIALTASKVRHRIK